MKHCVLSAKPEATTQWMLHISSLGLYLSSTNKHCSWYWLACPHKLDKHSVWVSLLVPPFFFPVRYSYKTNMRDEEGTRKTNRTCLFLAIPRAMHATLKCSDSKLGCSWPCWSCFTTRSSFTQDDSCHRAHLLLWSWGSVLQVWPQILKHCCDLGDC